MRSHSLSQHPSQRSVTTLASRYTTDSTSPVILAKDEPHLLPTSRADRLSFADDEPITEEPLTEELESRPRSATAIRIKDTKDSIPEAEAHDKFDDVTLHDPKPKRHWLPYRFGGGNSSGSTTTQPPEAADAGRPPSGGGHSFFGRKRGASGQGSELGNMIRRPASRGAPAVPEKNQTSSGAKSQVPTPSTDKGPFAAPKLPTTVDKSVLGASKMTAAGDKSARSTRPQTPLPAEKTAPAPVLASTSTSPATENPIASAASITTTETSPIHKTTAVEIASAVVSAPVVETIERGDPAQTQTTTQNKSAIVHPEATNDANPVVAGAQEMTEVDLA